MLECFACKERVLSFLLSVHFARTCWFETSIAVQEQHVAPAACCCISKNCSGSPVTCQWMNDTWCRRRHLFETLSQVVGLVFAKRQKGRKETRLKTVDCTYLPEDLGSWHPSQVLLFSMVPSYLATWLREWCNNRLSKGT